MSYTSGAPRNADPLPWHDMLGTRHATARPEDGFYSGAREPRPEFNLPPRNPNPILVDLRLIVRWHQNKRELLLHMYGPEGMTPIQVVRQAMIAGMYYAEKATPEHHSHAHRVLDKLEKTQ